MDHPAAQYRLPLPASPGPPLSEFNHHLAGVILLLIGVSAILTLINPTRFRWLRYVWPLSLMLLGVYLILYSDPEAWPSSYVSLAASWRDPQTQQHKIYALLLVVLGGIELTRASGIATNPKWKYAFPILAVIGGIYLIFHGERDMHEPTMQPSRHMLILYQHILYIVLGLGIAVTKFLADTHRYTNRYAPYVWPSLMIALGVVLVLYRE